MSLLVNERHIGSKHYHEYISPEGAIVNMGIYGTTAFHEYNGVSYITFDGTDTVIKTPTLGNTTISGTLDVSGDVTVGGNFSMTDTQWRDLKFPLTRDKQGQSAKPDFDFTNLGLLFPQNNEAEEVYLIAQFDHAYKHGSDISPHIHCIQDEAGIPVFEMTYRWEKNGATVGDWTTIETSATPVFTYTSGTIRQILAFPNIDGSSIDAVSSMMDIIIRRQTGDGIAGDVLVKEFDIHYEVDSLGSDTAYTK